VLQQDVALGDHAEDVVVLLQRRDDLRRERLVAVFAHVVARPERREIGRCSGAVEQVDVVRLQAQRRRRNTTTSTGVSCAISRRTALPRFARGAAPSGSS
jgi:hypothetical protein